MLVSGRKDRQFITFNAKFLLNQGKTEQLMTNAAGKVVAIQSKSATAPTIQSLTTNRRMKLPVTPYAPISHSSPIHAL